MIELLLSIFSTVVVITPVYACMTDLDREARSPTHAKVEGDPRLETWVCKHLDRAIEPSLAKYAVKSLSQREANDRVRQQAILKCMG